MALSIGLTRDGKFLELTGNTLLAPKHIPIDECSGLVLAALLKREKPGALAPLRVSHAGALALRKTPDPELISLEDLGL